MSEYLPGVRRSCENFTRVHATRLSQDRRYWTMCGRIVSRLDELDANAEATCGDCKSAIPVETRRRVDAAIAELRAAGTSGADPAVRDIRVRLMHKFGDGPQSRSGVLNVKAIVLAEKLERECFGWFNDTLGEDGTAPIREALRDAVAAYLVRTEAAR